MIKLQLRCFCGHAFMSGNGSKHIRIFIQVSMRYVSVILSIDIIDVDRFIQFELPGSRWQIGKAAYSMIRKVSVQLSTKYYGIMQLHHETSNP